MSEKDLESEKTEQIQVSVVTEEEKELAQNCHKEFGCKNFSACSILINKILASRQADPKVVHNRAVLQFYLSNFTKVSEFKKCLVDICSKAHICLDNVDNIDDVEHAIYFYNYAVLLYHLRQFRSAIIILDKVFQFIEPLDENVGRMVCFLLLELYLCTFQPDKALGMVGYIESTMYGSHESKAPTPDKETKEFSSSSKDYEGDSINESLKPKLQQYKARCYLMLRSIKGCKREIKGLVNSVQTGQTVFLKGNLEYLRGNYRKAIKVLNSAPSQSTPFSACGYSIPVMYYNNLGCIHFYMKRPHLGSFYFQKALKENEMAVKSLSVEKGDTLSTRPMFTLGSNYFYELMYNLGIQLLHARRVQEAFDCLIEALQVYHTNPRLWLRIAECCIQVHGSDNQADFRLKERKKDMVQGFVGSGPHRKMILTPAISNNYKKNVDGQSLAIPLPTLEFASLCLKNALLLLLSSQEETSQLSSASLASGSSDAENDLSSSGGNGSGLGAGLSQSENNLFIPAPPGNPISTHEVASLSCSILASSAYVALGLGDPIMALEYAEMLLAQPKLSGIHRFLGHLYAGEASVMLDRMSQAIIHLNPSNVRDLNLLRPTKLDKEEKGFSQDDTNNQENSIIQGWYPNSIAAARTVMLYNSTVAYTLKNDFEKANEILRQLNAIKGCGSDFPVQTFMLAMYIQTQLGHADLTKSIIKQHCPQYR